MLERLTIRNFQKHRKFVVEFDPHVTCFVGESDRGKSAVLRALRWVLFNRPQGDSLIRRGAGYCRVRLQSDGGQSTTRLKKGTRNLYRSGSHDYASFGSGVPDEIAKLLNVAPVNFQQQHDPPYWLTLSPGEVSRELNQIVNLGSIDASLSALSSELRKAKAAVEVSESRLKEAKDREESLRWTVEASGELEAIEEKERTVEKLRERAESLRSLLEGLRAAEKSRKRCTRASREGKALLGRGEKVLEARENAARLRGLLEDIKETREELCQAKDYVIELKAELREKIGDLCPLCGTTLTASRCSVLTCTSATDLP